MGVGARARRREGRLQALINLRPYRHLKGKPPEVILEALGHLLVRSYKEPPRKPRKAEPRERGLSLVDIVRLLARLF